MLAAPGSGPNVSLLSPGLDREGSVISDDAEMRSVADTVHSYGRRTAKPQVPAKEANAQLEEGTVLLGDQWVHVSSYSRLPTEVTEMLAEADLYIDAFQGFLDVTTGYACLLSRTQCFVWNYSSRGVGTSPTCFVFPVPEYASSSMTAANDLSFACFLPRSGGGREPALLLVAPDGQICLWEGISSSLTRSDRAQRITAPLSNNETIVQLQRVDESTVVLATSQSRLLRISLGTRAGVLQAEARPFSQPRGLLGRIFGSTSAMGSNDVVASIAVAPVQVGKQGRQVYAIGRKTLQKWQVLEQGGERLIGEQDVQQVVASAVLEQSEERYSAAESLAFDILDGAVQSDGKLVLLFAQSKGEHEPLTYGLALVDTLKDAGSFVVASISKVDYSTYPDPRPYAQPSLSIPRGGPSAFITFADTVVAKQLEKGCEGFEEVIKLKDDVKNRFIGSSCDSIHLGGDNAVAALSLISATSGSLLVETSISEIRKRCTVYTSTEDQNRADTDRLKGKLEQALYYSESPLNPLTFQLPAVLQGTLMTAAERLSKELLTFSNPISAKVPPSVDLRTALKDRIAKMKFLVRFIAQCGHMEKLPQTTRRALRSDAELACAMEGWWGYQNEFYSHNAGSGTVAGGVSPLAKAIEGVMMENGLGGGEDVVRRFFRHHADLTPQVLGKLLKQAKQVVTQPLGGRSRGVLELNRVVVGAFRAGLRYRKEFGGLYGVTEGEGGAAFEGWTAEPTSVHLLEALFSVTVNLIPDRTRELGSSIDSSLPTGGGGGEEQKIQLELKNQLCSLAELALACYSERLSYLSSAASSVSGGDSAVDRELSVFNTTYRTARPAFILPLISISRSDKAFSLAEQYHDFPTLVQLCTDPNLLSSARIDTYLERYKQDFAFELYSYYLEQDRPKVLLEQKSEHHNLVLEYLQQTTNERLGWLHDLALQRYSAASDKLEKLGLKEEVLGQRKLMLSLGKLGFLSGLGMEDIQKVGTQKQVEFFDDHLDLIAVQESLIVGWENSIPSLPPSLPLAGTAQAAELCSEIVDIIATRLSEYPAYKSHYANLVSKLLIQGKYLTSEDLIDLLTLKDTPPTQLEDFATAIKVLIRAQDLPKQRYDAALKGIWRRAVIRDDWISLSETGGISDQVVMQDLKSTALYAVLNEVLGVDGDRVAYLDLQSLVEEEEIGEGEAKGKGKERELLEARFGDAPDHFISLLMEDLEREKATVGGFLQDSDLPRLVGELAGVAAAEAEAEGELTLTRGEDGGDEGDDGEDSMLIE